MIPPLFDLEIVIEHAKNQLPKCRRLRGDRFTKHRSCAMAAGLDFPALLRKLHHNFDKLLIR